MEFEDIKKIWNQQKQEAMYVINEPTLHKLILKKKDKVMCTAAISEYLIATANFAGAIFVLGYSIARQNENVFTYLLAAVMVVLAAYVMAHRHKRRKLAGQFDRSMLGDLDFAIENAAYQASLSRFILLSVVPVGTFSLLNVWQKKGFGPEALGILSVFALAIWLGRWEHRRIHVARKEQLRKMREKLVGQ